MNKCRPRCLPRSGGPALCCLGARPSKLRPRSHRSHPGIVVIMYRGQKAELPRSCREVAKLRRRLCSQHDGKVLRRSSVPWQREAGNWSIMFGRTPAAPVPPSHPPTLPPILPPTCGPNHGATKIHPLPGLQSCSCVASHSDCSPANHCHTRLLPTSAPMAELCSCRLCLN